MYADFYILNYFNLSHCNYPYALNLGVRKRLKAWNLNQHVATPLEVLGTKEEQVDKENIINSYFHTNL